MATDPMLVYDAIGRLGRARLDQLVEELKPASRSTISRLIKRLAKQEMIHHAGYEWFPCVPDLTHLGSGAGTQVGHPGTPDLTQLCSGAGTQVGQECVKSAQVGHSGTQVGQVGQNDVELDSLKIPLHGPLPGEDPLIIADAADWVDFGRGKEENAETGASLPIGGSFGRQGEVENPAPFPLALQGAGNEANGSEANGSGSGDNGIPIRDMFTIKNNPEVMRYIVLKVRKSKSRHNRGEGAKWAQARAEGKFIQMKLFPKDRIEDMVYLADSISRSVAFGKWWEDEARHVAEMTRLIPDWRNGYKKALWDLDMVADEPAEKEVPAAEPIAVTHIEPAEQPTVANSMPVIEPGYAHDECGFDPEWDAQMKKHRESQADALAHVPVYLIQDPAVVKLAMDTERAAKKALESADIFDDRFGEMPHSDALEAIASQAPAQEPATKPVEPSFGEKMARLNQEVARLLAARAEKLATQNEGMEESWPN